MRARALAILLVLSCGGAVAQETARRSRAGETLVIPPADEVKACNPGRESRGRPLNVDVRLECDVESSGKIARCKIISTSDMRFDEEAVCIAELHRLSPGAPDSIIIPLRLTGG